MTALRQVTLTAAGVMLAAGIYEVIKILEPQYMLPFFAGGAAVLYAVGTFFKEA